MAVAPFAVACILNLLLHVMTSHDDWTIPKSDAPLPERPPRIATRNRFYRYQWLGIPVFVLIVVAALFGLFGHSMTSSASANESFSADIRYPERMRYKKIDPIELWVENRSGNNLSKATVLFPTEYMLQFSNVSFIPSANNAFEVELKNLAPGERRLVLGGLQAERYGRHTGTIEIRSDGEETLQIPVSTWSWP